MADLQALEARAVDIEIKALVESLFDLLRGHPRERAAALPLAETRMDGRTRRTTFRHILRKQVAAIMRARAPALQAKVARDLSLVVLQLMKAASSLSDEQGLPGRAAGLRELQALAVQYLERRLKS